jgi:sulfonate transport system substrate-binding protein
MIERRQALAAMAAAPFVLRTARAAPPSTIRIGFQKNGTFLIAKLSGKVEERLAREGVAVEWREFAFGPPLVEALNVGAIDLGSVGDTPPIFAQAARSKFVYAARHAATGAGVIAPKGSPIRAIADLKGKRVSIPKGSSAHNITVAALEKAGLSFKDIEPVYLAPADGQAAFASGAVDAWTIWDPYLAIAEETAGAKLVVLATDVAPQNSFALASRDFAEENGKILSIALEAIGEVGSRADGRRDETARLLAEATGVPLAAQQRAVARGSFGVGPITPEIVSAQQRSADRFAALGLIPGPIKVADAVWKPQG